MFMFNKTVSIMENNEPLTHLDIVNNLDIASEYIKNTWKNPDNYFLVEIIQRYKDNSNVLDDTGKSIFAKTKTINNKTIIDDNQVGSIFIRGNTLDDVINSLRAPKIFLYPEISKLLNVKGNTFNDLTTLCDMFNARAYLTSLRESFSRISEITNTLRTDNTPESTTISLGGCYVPNTIKQLEYRSDYVSKLIKFNFNTAHYQNPWSFMIIDCDIPKISVVNDVVKILNTHGITKCDILQSHNGYHILFYPEEIGMHTYGKGCKLKTALNKEFEKFGTQSDCQGKIENFSVMVEKQGFGKILLYSPVGGENRNISHPVWNRNRIY